MTRPDYDSKIADSLELQRYSQHFLEDFLEKEETIIYPPLDVNLFFHQSREAYNQDPKRAFAGPVFSEKNGDHFTIHLCEECLKDIPSLALQGWLVQELSLCIQKLQPEFYKCNFRSKIYPLWPVIGLAENHMREMVEDIETSLKKYLAIRQIIDLGLGASQVYFYFYSVNPSSEDKTHYEEAIPHGWTKALFLCRKLKEFIPIFLLAGKNVEFSIDLKSYWLKAHDYLLPEDVTLLKILAGIPEELQGAQYSDKVAEMFKKVKARLLTPGKTSITSPTIH
jgi:hypothetical protein